MYSVIGIAVGELDIWVILIQQIQKLQPHKHVIRKITSSTSKQNRRLLKTKIGNHVQTGGSMLKSILKVVVPIFQTLFH